MDVVTETLKDLLGEVRSGLREMGVHDVAPRNPFLRNAVLHPELYNTDKEAKDHDLSTKEGVILSMMRIK